MSERDSFPTFRRLAREARAATALDPPAAGDSRPLGVERGASALLLLAALTPVVAALPRLLEPGVLLSGDAATHAQIAREIARTNAGRGWIEAFNGGFPLGYHYPPLGWLAAAALIKLGVGAGTAIHALGIGAMLLAPVLGFAALVAVGRRGAAALAGAIALAWIAPYVHFVGGWQAFLLLGLLSQVIAVPLVIGFVGAVSTPGRGLSAAVLGAVAVAAHPQLTAIAGLAVAAGSAAAGRTAIRRVVLPLVAIGVSGLAMYGPGIASLGAPFGWPDDLGWRQLGFGSERLGDWFLGGDLLDFRHTPAITDAFLLSLAVLVARLRHPSARALLAATVTVVVVAVSGHALQGAGRVGASLLSFFQPMRALALVPLAAAACIAFAADGCFDALERLAVAPVRTRALLGVGARVAFVGALAAGLWPRGPELGAFTREQEAYADDGKCDVPGYSTARVREWLDAAPEDRVDFSEEAPLALCAYSRGAALSRGGPFGLSKGAGAHVGVLQAAFGRLRADEVGGDARAETLGVRSLIARDSQAPAPPSAWRTTASGEGIRLSTRIGGSGFIGAGCVRSRWRGSEGAIRAELFRVLREDASFLDTPATLTALEATSGPLARDDVDDPACDATAAGVSGLADGHGFHRAQMTSAAPVDAVVRVTAFPGWQVRIDGAVVPWSRVAPGFPRVRVPPGTHLIEAEMRPSPRYIAGLALAAAAVVALGLGARRASRDGPPPA